MFSEQIWTYVFSEMVIGLRLEDRLDEVANFIPWKVRIVLILEKNEVWDDIGNNTQAKPVQVPASIYATLLATLQQEGHQGEKNYP